MARRPLRRAAAVAAAAAAVAAAATTALLPHPAAGAPTDGTPWFYEGPSGPDHWHALDDKFTACGAGDRQSPINVVVSPPVATQWTMHNLARPGPGALAAAPGPANVPLACDDAGPCGVLRWHNATYALVDVHVHVPAEHTMNGRAYPLEVHFVHASADTKEIAVVGVLFDFVDGGQTPHPVLQRLLDAKAAAANVSIPGAAPAPAPAPAPAEAAANDDNEGPRVAINTTEWEAVVRPGSGFCHLEGSLTTPPCTEGLSWFLQADVLPVSRVQVSAFTAIRNASPDEGNARPLQDTNGREVVCYGPVAELAAAGAASRASPSPSPSPPPSSPGGGGDDAAACFPASATVTTAAGATVRMADVAVGTVLRTGPASTSAVYTWSHRLPAGRHPFVRLTTADGRALTASPGHLVYANGALTAAADVAVGDTLPSIAANASLALSSAAATVAATPARVVAVDRVVADGLFHPHTLDGDLVVDGFVVSTWTTAVSVGAARAALAPLAAVYRWTGWSVSVLHGGGRGWVDAARTLAVAALERAAIADGGTPHPPPVTPPTPFKSIPARR